MWTWRLSQFYHKPNHQKTHGISQMLWCGSTFYLWFQSPPGWHVVKFLKIRNLYNINPTHLPRTCLLLASGLPERKVEIQVSGGISSPPLRWLFGKMSVESIPPIRDKFLKPFRFKAWVSTGIQSHLSGTSRWKKMWLNKKHKKNVSCTLGIQLYAQMMIRVSNHLQSIWWAKI